MESRARSLALSGYNFWFLYYNWLKTHDNDINSLIQYHKQYLTLYTKAEIFSYNQIFQGYPDEKYFSQKDLLKRVPQSFLIVSAVSCVLLSIAITLVCWKSHLIINSILWEYWLFHIHKKSNSALLPILWYERVRQSCTHWIFSCNCR